MFILPDPTQPFAADLSISAQPPVNHNRDVKTTAPKWRNSNVRKGTLKPTRIFSFTDSLFGSNCKAAQVELKKKKIRNHIV